MSHIAEALARVKTIAASAITGRLLSDNSFCALASRDLPALERAIDLPGPLELETIRDSLQAACAGPGAATLPARQLRQAPLVFWHGSPPAAGFAGLLDTFLGRAGKRQAWLRTLIEAWLRDFEPGAVGLASTGDSIARLLHGTYDPRLQSWATAHADYHVFDASSGPMTIAQALLGGPRDVPAVCRATGLDDPVRAEGAYFKAVLQAVLACLPHALATSAAPEAWARAAALLESKGMLRHNSIEMAGAVAEAALQAWIGRRDKAAPQPEVQRFLIRLVGDPRMRAGNWIRVRPECIRVMRSWLAEATLEAFFSLITDSTEARRWDYRRAFWLACLRKSPNAEAWVVLGKRLAVRAQSKKDLADCHGYLNGSDDQAVIIIRLGDYVFTEWSDIGRMRVYRHGAKHCPPLYSQGRRDYHAGDLKSPDSLPFPKNPLTHTGGRMGSEGLIHSSSKQGLWQGAAAEFMLRNVGFRLERHEYMPS